MWAGLLGAVDRQTLSIAARRHEDFNLACMPEIFMAPQMWFVWSLLLIRSFYFNQIYQTNQNNQPALALHAA